jgi:hypothetical protein
MAVYGSWCSTWPTACRPAFSSSSRVCARRSWGSPSDSDSDCGAITMKRRSSSPAFFFSASSSSRDATVWWPRRASASRRCARRRGPTTTCSTGRRVARATRSRGPAAASRNGSPGAVEITISSKSCSPRASMIAAYGSGSHHLAVRLDAPQRRSASVISSRSLAASRNVLVVDHVAVRRLVLRADERGPDLLPLGPLRIASSRLTGEPISLSHDEDCASSVNRGGAPPPPPAPVRRLSLRSPCP